MFHPIFFIILIIADTSEGEMGNTQTVGVDVARLVANQGIVRLPREPTAICRGQTRAINFGSLATSQSAENSSLRQTLLSRLSTINIDREELERAENLVRAVGIQNWEEETVINFLTNIEKENLPEISNIIAANLRLDSEQKAQIDGALKRMRFARSVESQIVEFSFNQSNCKSIYGFLYAEREENGKISLGLAFHTSRFSVGSSHGNHQADDIVSLIGVLTGSFGLLPLNPIATVNTGLTGARLEESEVKQVMNSFIRHRALESLKTSGMNAH